MTNFGPFYLKIISLKKKYFNTFLVQTKKKKKKSMTSHTWGNALVNMKAELPIFQQGRNSRMNRATLTITT